MAATCYGCWKQKPEGPTPKAVNSDLSTGPADASGSPGTRTTLYSDLDATAHLRRMSYQIVGNGSPRERLSQGCQEPLASNTQSGCQGTSSQRTEERWRWRNKLQKLCRSWMLNCQLCGMQCKAPNWIAGTAVGLVADDRMSLFCKVYANLVLATCLKLHFYECSVR